MKKLMVIPCVLFASVLIASSAHASFIFEADLFGFNENPPNPSPGFGFIQVTLEDDLNTLDVFETFSDLLAPTTAAHLHCCAPIGSNAGVVLPFAPGFGFPLGVTSGTYSHVFNLSTDLVVITPGVFIAGLESGMVYANIHTQEFPGGEIRGQLAAVPEPGSIMLLGSGLVIAARSLRRQRGKK